MLAAAFRSHGNLNNEGRAVFFAPPALSGEPGVRPPLTMAKGRTLALLLLLPSWAASAWLPGHGRVAKKDANTSRPTAEKGRPGGMMFLSMQQARARARAESREQRQLQQQETLPKRIGLEDVNQPTAIPPPPPELDAWADMQPIDTHLGIMFISRFADKPTVTPPPRQSSLDVSFACPLLSEWPEVVEVDALSSCASSATGNWTVQGDAESAEGWILTWTMTCGLFEGGTAPVVKYAMPTGDLFGSSTIMTSLWGNTMALRDCAGNLKYTIDEKVYHEAGETDPHACEVYGSCDGTIWMQYIVHDEAGDVVARTAYLHIFQDSFKILDAEGSEVASVSRVGQWRPHDGQCGPRKWRIAYSGSTGGVFSAASDQWPLSQLVTMMAIRDEYRNPTGLTRPSLCEVVKFGVRLLLFIFLAGLCCGSCLMFFRVWIGPVRSFLVNLENSVCPARMRKPTGKC